MRDLIPEKDHRGNCQVEPEKKAEDTLSFEIFHLT